MLVKANYHPINILPDILSTISVNKPVDISCLCVDITIIQGLFACLSYLFTDSFFAPLLITAGDVAMNRIGTNCYERMNQLNTKGEFSASWIADQYLGGRALVLLAR